MCGANPERSQTGDYAITGTVVVDGERKAGAYVRLLDKNGEFVAESPTSKGGAFAFLVAQGSWTVRLVLPSGSIDRSTVVVDQAGSTVEFVV